MNKIVKILLAFGCGFLLLVALIIILLFFWIANFFNSTFKKGTNLNNDQLISLFQNNKSEFEQIEKIAEDSIPTYLNYPYHLFDTYTNIENHLQGQELQTVKKFISKNGFFDIEMKIDKLNKISGFKIEVYYEYGFDGGMIRSIVHSEDDLKFVTSCKEIKSEEEINKFDSVKEECSYTKYLQISENWFIEEWRYNDKSADPF